MADGQRTLGKVAVSARAAGLIGRGRERAAIARCLAPDGPAIVWLHGPSGVGKTALLAAFADDCAAAGVRPIRLEGGAVEPRPEDVTAAIATELGGAAVSVAALAALIAGQPEPVAIVLDDADTQRLTAVWLRRTLAPALPSGTRLVISARQPPHLAWTLDFGPLFLVLPLGPLGRDDVLLAAAGAGLDTDAAEAVWRLSQGLPLAVQMALRTAPGRALGADAAADLARALLDAAADPEFDRVVEAAAVVRRAA